MIYFLAEFCLNSLNGTFFDSTAKIENSKLLHAKYAPLVALYVLIVGFNTINISVVLSQMLFLYNIFHSIDEQFIRIISNLFNRNTNIFGTITMNIVKNIPVIPLFISLCLNGAYISYSNRCNALLSRILYTLSAYISTLFFNEFIVIKISEFTLSYLVNSLFSKFYLISQLKTSALIFSFSGTYFFLKTHNKNSIFEFMSEKVYYFPKPSYLSSDNEIESYLTFMVLFYISFLRQMMIRSIILRTIKRSKSD